MICTLDICHGINIKLTTAQYKKSISPHIMSPMCLFSQSGSGTLEVYCINAL